MTVGGSPRCCCLITRSPRCYYRPIRSPFPIVRFVVRYVVLRYVPHFLMTFPVPIPTRCCSDSPTRTYRDIYSTPVRYYCSAILLCNFDLTSRCIPCCSPRISHVRLRLRCRCCYRYTIYSIIAALPFVVYCCSGDIAPLHFLGPLVLPRFIDYTHTTLRGPRPYDVTLPIR